MSSKTPRNNEPIAVIINGRAGVGKDLFVTFCSNYLEEHNLKAGNYSSVHNVKTAARILGWDEEKDEKGRQFLSDLKDMSTKLYNGPLTYMLDVLKENKHHEKLLFFHIREPEEVQRFENALDDNHILHSTLLIRRDGITSFGNHADMRVEEYEYDIIVHNDGTIIDLEQKAEEFVNKLVF